MKVVVWLTLAVVLGGLTVSFSTCRSETAGGRVELTLFDWDFPSTIQLDRKRIEIFEKEHPNIKVRLVTGQEEKYLTMVTAGVAPDVATTGYGHIPYYAKRGAIYAMDDFIAEDKSKREAILALDKIDDIAARRKGILALDQSVADDGAKAKAVEELEKADKVGKKFSCAEHFNIDQYYNLDDYFASAVDSVRYGKEGKIFALASEGSPVAIIYNKNLFDRYNNEHPKGPKLEYPNEKWTRRDFRHAAKVLTQDRDGDGRTDMFGTSIGFHRNRFPMYIWQDGGEVISADKRRCLMDSEVAIGAITWMHDLLWVDQSAPTSQTQMEGVSEQSEGIRFKEQRIAMLLTTRYAYFRLQGKVDFKWDIAPPPKGKVSRMSIYIGGGWMIARQTLHPKEAWTLAKFLVGKRSSRMAMEGGRALTANRVVAEEMLRRPGTDPPHDYFWIDIMEESRPKDFEFRVGMGHYFDTAMNEISEIPQGRRKPRQACLNCTRIFNEGLKFLWEKKGGP